jgi:hypothetical protein
MATLVVTQPFGDYAIGDEITAPDAVEAVLANNPGSVVRRAEVAAPKADKAPPPADPTPTVADKA